jgi:hypothetical protein
MAEEYSIEALRTALQSGEGHREGEEEQRFLAQARRFESAVAQLVAAIRGVLERVPELEVTLIDEVETFTSPAYPGRATEIRDQRIRITRGEDFLLFDPTAKALLSALGQVEIQASRPIPFLVEKLLYLIPQPGTTRAVWGYRSVEDLGGPLAPFGEQALLRLLHAVFVAPA